MDTQKRLNLIKEVGEEIITENELKELLEAKSHPIAYDGFEPSGSIHIAQGILRAININKMTKAGCKFKMFVADWHAWANNKLDGNLENIQTAGKYFIEVWKASGMELDNVEFVWSSGIVKDDSYWKTVMEVARNSTVNRIIRCGQIMGRKESDVMQASQILYPCMQAADIFQMGVDIAQLGMDQRKVNVLARELAPKLGFNKPVAVHHHMIMGLGQPVSPEKDAVEMAIDFKMSKSNPDSAIFMTDSADEIKRKLNRAYCPEKVTELNPVIEYCRYLIFERYKTMKIERPEKFGGNLEIAGFDELCDIYKKGKLHPMDLKNAVNYYINDMVEPVRKHFEKNKKAKELLEAVSKFKITR